MAPVIVAEELGKRYLLGERADAYGTLRGAIAGLLRRGSGSRREPPCRSHVSALSSDRRSGR